MNDGKYIFNLFCLKTIVLIGITEEILIYNYNLTLLLLTSSLIDSDSKTIICESITYSHNLAIVKNGFQISFSISVKRCCLHIGEGNSKEKIVVFTEETLQRCYEKKSIRDRNKKKKSKFDAIVLPERSDGIVGYHPSCSRYYCSVRERKSHFHVCLGL